MEFAATDYCNDLSRRWSTVLAPEDNAVFSGPGAWVVLASLLSGANGVAREELEGALGLKKDVTHLAVRSLLDRIAVIDSITLAAGLWFSPKIEIHDNYATRLHPVPVRPLPENRSELDDWVRTHTNGRIAGFSSRVTQASHTPLPVAHSETMMVIASVVSAMADWTEPFMELPGYWGPRDEPCNWLTRCDRNLEAAALISAQGTTVSRVICETRGGFDVHLLGGEVRDLPGTVLGAGFDALSGRAKVVSAASLKNGDRGGCLSVRTVERIDAGLPLYISLPAFEFSESTDMTTTPELFGIATALDKERGHFPDISGIPIYLGRAEQSIAVGFQASGFYADALTEVEMQFAGNPSQALAVDVSFDRPFGFLVVEKEPGLVVFGGWVAHTETGTGKNSFSGW